MNPLENADLKAIREIVARAESRVHRASAILSDLALDLLELKTRFCRYPVLEPPDLSEGRDVD